MATKHLISPGIGFTPGSVKFIVTRGLTPVAFTPVAGIVGVIYRPSRVGLALRPERVDVSFGVRRTGTVYRPKRVGTTYRPDRAGETESDRQGGT